MGIWGTGLYSNDTALEVKEVCENVFAFYSVEKGNRILFNVFNELLSSNLIDDDYASFWYALADWQWDHGILTEPIRLKAIQLLDVNVGNWKENTKEEKKRIEVLQNLRQKLFMDMPPQKLPSAKLNKPKHKPGDILVFHSKNQGAVWEIKLLPLVPQYRDSMIRNFPCDLSPSFDGSNMYYAILCVGSVKIPRAEYLCNAFDEYAVYAFYDYCSPLKPSAERLEECGFLPALQYDYDCAQNRWINLGWTYTFYTSLGNSKKEEIQSYEKIVNPLEHYRFQRLLSIKNYAQDPLYCVALHTAYYNFFSEKIRLHCIDIPLDNLLSNNVNPQLFEVIPEP